MGLPQVVWLAEPPALEAQWKRCGALPTASPKVWMDAYLAAFAISGGIELVTFDRDFSRFTQYGLRAKILGGKPTEPKSGRRGEEF